MAKNISLENHSLDDLLALRDKIDLRLKKLVAAEMDALEKRMAELAKYSGKPAPVPGHALAAGTSTKPGKRTSKRKGKKAPAKFRDPKSGNSWSGRGLTPVWLRDFEANGGKRADLAV